MRKPGGRLPSEGTVMVHAITPEKGEERERGDAGVNRCTRRSKG